MCLAPDRRSDAAVGDDADSVGEDVDEERSEASDESDGSRDVTLRAKWQMDGARTLDEAVEKLLGFVEHIKALRDEGWRLRTPINDDYGFLTHDRHNADGSAFVSELVTISPAR